MNTVNGQKQNKSTLLGAPTPAKASGLAFTLAALLPTLFALFFLVAASSLGLMTEGYQQRDWYLYANYLLTQLSFAVVALLFLRYRQTPVKRAIVSQKCHPKYFLVALLLQIGLLSLSELNGIFLTFLERFGYQNQPIILPSTDGFGIVGVLLVVAVLPAVFEEIIFRGALLDGLKKTFSLPVAALICGGLFSLYHQNPAQTVYQFCCGAAFALVAMRAGSILPTVLSHFVNNAFIVILYACNVQTIPTPVFVPLMILSAICLVASLVWLIFIDKSGSPVETDAEKTEKAKSEKGKFFLFAAIGIAVCTLTWVAVFIQGL